MLVKTTNDIEIEQVPQIFTWMEQLLTSEAEVADFPICFEQTRIVTRLYQILFHREASYLLRLREEPE